MTTHQQAVSDHRRVRVNNILDLGVRTRLKAAKSKREEQGVILQAWKRIRMLPSGWDSEDEGLDKPKEDSKDKDKDDNSKNKLKEEEKAAAALRKAAGHTIILGGFRLPKTDKEIERERSRDIFKPDPDEDDDHGEQAIYFTDSIGRYCERLDHWEDLENRAAPLREPPEQKQPYQSEWEREEIEIETELTATLTPRPRQARRRGGPAAGSRKSKGGASKSATAVKDEEAKDDTPSVAPPPADEDETMADGDETVGDITQAGDAGELDDDDRELLGEADGDDSDDEDEAEEMDED